MQHLADVVTLLVESGTVDANYSVLPLQSEDGLVVDGVAHHELPVEQEVQRIVILQLPDNDLASLEVLWLKVVHYFFHEFSVNLVAEAVPLVLSQL